MIRLVKGHRYVSLALGNRPALDDLALVPVDDLHLALCFVIHVHSRAGPFKPHSFEGIAIDFYVGHLFPGGDRKSTRLNASHAAISYAVFGLKKKVLSCAFI